MTYDQPADVENILECTDILTLQELLSQKKTIISKLEKKQKKYEAIFQGLSDGLLLIDDRVTDCNINACQIWGYNEDEVIGFFPSDFAPLTQPDGHCSFKKAKQKINEAFDGKPQRFEWKDTRRDGVQIDTEVRLNRIEVDGKKYVLATSRDITDAKTKENERQALLHMMEQIIEDRTRSLQEKNASLNEEIARRMRIEHDLERAYLELQELFNTAGDGVLVIDKNREILRANPAFLALVEKSYDEVVGAKCYDIFPCRIKCTNHCIIQELVLKGSQTDFEKEFTSNSGKQKSCMVKASVLRNSSNEVLGIVKNYKDMTNYKHRVDMLQESEEFHRLTLESISDAIFLTNCRGEFTFISCNAQKIFGYSTDEIRAKFTTIFELIGQDFFSFQELEKESEISNREVKIIDKSGNSHVLFANIKKAEIRSGTTLIAFRDITYRRQAEERAKIEYEQLIQAGKMVSLGILVSGVAHEINNPNNSIMLNVPLLSRIWVGATAILDEYMDKHGDFQLGNLRYSCARDRVPDLFSGLLNSSKRIKHIVNDLKNYARQGSTDLTEIIDINAAFKASVLLLGNQITKSTNNFDVEYGLGIPHLQGNFLKIQQVFINLLQNACQALENKSQAIRVRTGFDHLTTSIWVQVSDEGIGIKSEDLPHVTDPFFTTKRTCGGTGLGLSISSRILSEHGGKMAFHSEHMVGTTVTLNFPVQREDE